MSDSNQNLETKCNSKLKFAELKDFFIKRVQKNYSKMNYVAMQLTTNTALLELRFLSERYHFRLWVFASISKYFYC